MLQIHINHIHINIYICTYIHILCAFILSISGMYLSRCASAAQNACNNDNNNNNNTTNNSKYIQHTDTHTLRHSHSYTQLTHRKRTHKNCSSSKRRQQRSCRGVLEFGKGPGNRDLFFSSLFLSLSLGLPLELSMGLSLALFAHFAHFSMFLLFCLKLRVSSIFIISLWEIVCCTLTHTNVDTHKINMNSTTKFASSCPKTIPVKSVRISLLLTLASR